MRPEDHNAPQEANNAVDADQIQRDGERASPVRVTVGAGHPRTDLTHACPSHAQCPTCGGPVYFLVDLPDGQLPLPVEPLYELAVAAVLIPCSLNTLKFKLHKHKDVFEPPYYRLDSEH